MLIAGALSGLLQISEISAAAAYVLMGGLVTCAGIIVAPRIHRKDDPEQGLAENKTVPSFPELMNRLKQADEPILQVTLLEPTLEMTKHTEGRIQALQVEITQGGAVDPCYAVASLEEPDIKHPGFNLMWLLGGGLRPRLTHTPFQMRETSEKIVLVPHVPMLVAVLVAEREKKSGKIDFGFGGSRFYLDEMRKDYDQFVLKVRFAGKELRDEKTVALRFRLDLNAPWKEMKFVQIM